VSCSNPFFIMFFILSLTFIKILRNRTGVGTHRIAGILMIFSQINHNSEPCSNPLFIMFFILSLTFMKILRNRTGVGTHRS
jgi:hypothetical protein